MPPPIIQVLGGGPAGASAALSAMLAGAHVTLREKSRLPRHKVCGEFFSPEIERELQALGAWDAFRSAAPARIERMALHLGKRSRCAPLPEGAWGLSRYVFDDLLMNLALDRGLHPPPAMPPNATVIATGRKSSRSAKGSRLFGFKAHFAGPTDDAVELFFFDGAYVGVAPIEAGATNVCGLGPESFLARFGFEFDSVIGQCPALADRLRPLHRTMDWVSTGPLEYGQHFADAVPGAFPEAYAAGDALSFVDPFTGSGLLAAVRTGALAGRAAARGDRAEDYLRQSRASLRKPFAASAALRGLVKNGWADKLLGLAPSRMLYALTRPR